MVTITNLVGRSIFDCHGNPTVEVDVHLSNGNVSRAAVPSGASAGKKCAREGIDGGSSSLVNGVSKAVNNVNSIIAPALIGKDPTDQIDIDKLIAQRVVETRNEWDWCNDKLAINVILAVSSAVCRAGASIINIPLYKYIADLSGNIELVLPVPIFTAINGGSHAGNKLAVQELMIIPVGASSFKEAMEMGMEVIYHLKAVIEKRYGQDAIVFGLDGGFAPSIQGTMEGLELLKTAIDEAGYTDKVVIGMNVAASEFYGSDKTYNLNFNEENNSGKQNISDDLMDFYNSFMSFIASPWPNNDGNNDWSQKVSGDQLKDLYISYVSEYRVLSIEDAFDQDDWEHYAKLTREIGAEVQIVGGDLLVTNPERVEKAIRENTCNALLLKVNEVGSVTEIIEAVRKSKHAGWGVMTSHCSGETEDTFIADLSVGLATGQIKAGALCGSEHVAKYNQLLRIEEELGSEAVYAGASFRTPVSLY